MGNGLIRAIFHIRNGTARCHAGTDCAAISRQSTNTGLDMNGHQIRNQQRTIDLLLRLSGLPAINHYGYRNGNALIAAATIDVYRHLAAIHACIRARRRPSAHLGLHILSTQQHHLANVCAVAALQALFSNGHIAFDLLVQQVPYQIQSARICKIQNAAQRQNAAISLLHSGRHTIDRLVHQICIVFHHSNNIGVTIHNPHLGSVALGFHGNNNIKNLAGSRMCYLNVCLLQICTDFCHLRIGNLGNNLQLLVSLAGYNAGCCCGFNAVQASGMRNDNALDILYNVSADFYQSMFRHAAQHFSCLCGCISHSDGFCATHGRNQFFF